MRLRTAPILLLPVAAATAGSVRAAPAADTLPPNLYAAAGAGMLSPVARAAVPFVYVPNRRMARSR